MRHKWIKNIAWKGKLPDGVYEVDQCTKCGMLCFHKYEFRFYPKTYLISGVEYEKLPECKSKNQLPEASGALLNTY